MVMQDDAALSKGEAAPSDCNTNGDRPASSLAVAPTTSAESESDAPSTTIRSPSALSADDNAIISPEETTSNGHPSPVKARDRTTRSVSSGSGRSVNSKIANLRAAFEKGNTTESSSQRRFASRERKDDRLHMTTELKTERELRIMYEEKCTALGEEVESLRDRLEQSKAEWKRRSREMQQEHERTMQQVQTARASVDPRAIDLQRQIRDLKQSIANSTMMESQITDSTFAQEMGVLHHELQNWIVNNFRRAKADIPQAEIDARIGQVSPAKHSETLRSIYQGFEPAAKLAFYQATAMVYVMDIFDDPLLFGLPDQQDWTNHVRQVSDSLQEVLDGFAFNRWRATTLDCIRQSNKIREPIGNAAEEIAELICVTLGALTDMDLPTEPGRVWMASLMLIIMRAIRLAHLFRIQRPQYTFCLPAASAPFDPSMMEGMFVDNEPSSERVVRCAASPSVIKIGDPYGDNAHLRNIVVKAKVICDAG